MKLPLGGDDSDLTVSLVAPSGDLTELRCQTLLSQSAKSLLSYFHTVA